MAETFSAYLDKKKKPQPRKKYENLNKHINFEREGKKSSARKWATEVVCCQCHKTFILPFKPRKPEVYCDACFKRIKR